MSASVSPGFFLCVLAYYGITFAYSHYLKRKLMIDVICLALLYSARVLAGGVAAHIVLSHWLLAFSMFVFTSLALVKRYWREACISHPCCLGTSDSCSYSDS